MPTRQKRTKGSSRNTEHLSASQPALQAAFAVASPFSCSHKLDRIAVFPPTSPVSAQSTGFRFGKPTPQGALPLQRVTGAPTVQGALVSASSATSGMTAEAIQRVKISNKVPGRYPLDNTRQQIHLNGTSVNISDGQYNYVVMDGSIFVSAASNAGHPLLAEGKAVDYAGMLKIEEGELVGWNNHSGHYRPEEGLKGQAGMPLDLFSTWQQWQTGGWPNRHPMTGGQEHVHIPRGIPIPPNSYSILDDEDGANSRKSNKLCPGCTIM
jgi:hypothetical protein